MLFYHINDVDIEISMLEVSNNSNHKCEVHETRIVVVIKRL